MQGTFDELYQKSQNGEVFENLMDLILSRDNILLAYRNIKANKGSYTAGTDKKNITDIGNQTPDDVVKRVTVKYLYFLLKRENVQSVEKNSQISCISSQKREPLWKWLGRLFMWSDLRKTIFVRIKIICWMNWKEGYRSI